MQEPSDNVAAKVQGGAVLENSCRLGVGRGRATGSVSGGAQEMQIF